MALSRDGLEIDKSVAKALVVLFGPREAARQLQMNENTMCAWARNNGWKKATQSPAPTRDLGEIIKTAVERSKQLSTIHLAKYTEKAAIAASESEKPLEVARKVRDVAGVYSTLWPQDKSEKLIEGEILLGVVEVADIARVEGEVLDVEPVREELSDGRPPSD
jgi:hypothetical protein